MELPSPSSGNFIIATLQSDCLMMAKAGTQVVIPVMGQFDRQLNELTSAYHTQQLQQLQFHHQSQQLAHSQQLQLQQQSVQSQYHHINHTSQQTLSPPFIPTIISSASSTPTSTIPSSVFSFDFLPPSTSSTLSEASINIQPPLPEISAGSLIPDSVHSLCPITTTTTASAAPSIIHSISTPPSAPGSTNPMPESPVIRQQQQGQTITTTPSSRSTPTTQKNNLLNSSQSQLQQPGTILGTVKEQNNSSSYSLSAIQSLLDHSNHYSDVSSSADSEKLLVIDEEETATDGEKMMSEYDVINGGKQKEAENKKTPISDGGTVKKLTTTAYSISDIIAKKYPSATIDDTLSSPAVIYNNKNDNNNRVSSSSSLSPSVTHFNGIPSGHPIPAVDQRNGSEVQQMDSKRYNTMRMISRGGNGAASGCEQIVHERPEGQTKALWEFLRDLLYSGKYNDIIHWTENRGEFKLADHEEVARLWGAYKNKPNMNYDKMSRAIRYYYDKNIIHKVASKKYAYRLSEEYLNKDIVSTNHLNNNNNNNISANNNHNKNSSNNNHNNIHIPTTVSSSSPFRLHHQSPTLAYPQTQVKHPSGLQCSDQQCHNENNLQLRQYNNNNVFSGSESHYQQHFGSLTQLAIPCSSAQQNPNPHHYNTLSSPSTSSSAHLSISSLTPPDSTENLSTLTTTNVTNPPHIATTATNERPMDLSSPKKLFRPTPISLSSLRNDSAGKRKRYPSSSLSSSNLLSSSTTDKTASTSSSSPTTTGMMKYSRKLNRPKPLPLNLTNISSSTAAANNDNSNNSISAVESMFLKSNGLMGNSDKTADQYSPLPLSGTMPPSSISAANQSMLAAALSSPFASARYNPALHAALCSSWINGGQSPLGSPLLSPFTTTSSSTAGLLPSNLLHSPAAAALLSPALAAAGILSPNTAALNAAFAANSLAVAAAASGSPMCHPSSPLTTVFQFPTTSTNNNNNLNSPAASAFNFNLN